MTPSAPRARPLSLTAPASRRYHRQAREAVIDEAGFSETMGSRLRAARRRRGWSLSDVERLSDQEFKASVLGAYERGERSLSVQRLSRLAALYGLEVTELIPPPNESGPSDLNRVVVDLSRLDDQRGSEMLDRFLASIQLMRRSGAGERTVRHSDLAILASMLSLSSSTADQPTGSTEG